MKNSNNMEDLSRYNAEGTTLRKAQICMLNILVEVDKICRKHNIRYWIDFGTLLGAVRHKGFIPWDDDIDISIMSEDYERLRKILIEELPDRYKFQDTSTDKYAFFTYGRIRDTKTYCFYPLFVKLKEQGLWIDIFTYDRVGSVKLKEFVDFFYRRAYHEIHHYGDVAYTSKFRIIFNRIVAYILYPFSWLGVLLLRLNGKKSKYGLYTRFSFPNTNYDEKNMFPLTEIEFEGHMFFAPKDYDSHLKGIYGDYMSLPSEDKREQILDMQKIKFFD